MKLFMVLIGCTPPGRHTEQHDVYFGIGETIKDLIPQFLNFWPEAKGQLHLDGWREVNYVDGYKVEVVKVDTPAGGIPAQIERLAGNTTAQKDASVSGIPALFFLNLGGYKPNELEEFHYKMLVAAPDKGMAIRRAKETAFYKHTGFKGAASHIDDKYGVDVDDVYAIADILDPFVKHQYRLRLSPANEAKEDEIHLGYFMLEKL